MQKIEEYTSSTSKYELYSHLIDKIVFGDIRTFSGILEYAKNINFDSISDGREILKKLFFLIRKTYWGFFNSLDKESYSKLWEMFVIEHPKYDFAGDLKLSLSIADMYIGMLDVHGYTKFCDENKNNLSKMHSLDDLLQNKISEVARHYNVISSRKQGDEIVLVSPSATDALNATIAIIGVLSKKKYLSDCPNIDTSSMPEFKVSAGIAGGNTNSSLIITEDGDLSGFLINNAARMQARANSLSPSDNKVIVTKNLQFSFIKDNTKNPCELYNLLSFYDNGMISFKGTDIPIVEIIFNDTDKYKENFFSEMEEVVNSVKGNLWKQKLFVDIIDLIIKVMKSMPEFTVNEKVNDYISGYSNSTIIELCENCKGAYIIRESYKEAIDNFGLIVSLLKKIPNFDKMVLEYSENIYEGYNKVLPMYDIIMKKEIDLNINKIFASNHITLFQTVQKANITYNKLLDVAMNSEALKRRKSIWYGILEKELSNLVINMYSGKK